MTMGGLLDRVVNGLEQDQNLPRIKKLLYCACYGSWEEDLAQINRVSLRDVVNAVWDQSPTLDALQFQLNRIVKTLNKPVEYAHVANSILRQVEPLYRDAFDVTRPLQRQAAPEATRWLAPPPAPTPPPSPTARLLLQAQVLQALTSHSEQNRLKKMMLCACSNAWENDAQRLALIDWSQLLQSLLQRLPTIEALERSLQEIISALSKPLDYVPIANLLLQMVAPLYASLYGNGQANSYANQPEATQFFGAPEATQFFGSGMAAPQPKASPAYSGPIRYPAAPAAPISSSATQWAAVPPEPTGVLYPAAPEPTGVLYPQSPEPSERTSPERVGPDRFGPNGQSYSPIEAYGRPSEPIQVVEPVTLEARSIEGTGNADRGKSSGDLAHGSAKGPAAHPFVPVQDERNLPFTLRLEIIKYANPLMAKMVMFSVLKRPFNFGEQDWLDLQDVSLDELLSQIQADYPSLAELESKLCTSADQLTEVKERALQAAAAIVKALKPIYARAQPAPRSRLSLGEGSDPALADSPGATPIGAISAPESHPSAARNGFFHNGLGQNGNNQNGNDQNGSTRIVKVQP